MVWYDLLKCSSAWIYVQKMRLLPPLYLVSSTAHNTHIPNYKVYCCIIDYWPWPWFLLNILISCLSSLSFTFICHGNHCQDYGLLYHDWYYFAFVWNNIFLEPTYVKVCIFAVHLKLTALSTYNDTSKISRTKIYLCDYANSRFHSTTDHWKKQLALSSFERPSVKILFSILFAQKRLTIFQISNIRKNVKHCSHQSRNINDSTKNGEHFGLIFPLLYLP